MFKKLIQTLGSLWLMVILFVILAVALGSGTFIENAFSIDAARIYIYNSWWFEATMGLFVVNFFLNLKRYNLHKRHKWPTLTIHLALVIIIIGAFITRYYGFTGLMSIREDGTSNEVVSDGAYLEVELSSRKGNQIKRQFIEKEVLLSGATSNWNDFSIQTGFDNKNITISYRDFVEGAAWKLNEDGQGKLYLKVVETKGGEKHEHLIGDNELFQCEGTVYSYNSSGEATFRFTTQGNVIVLETPLRGSLLEMATGDESELVPGNPDTLKVRSLYDFGAVKFVVPEPPVRGTLQLESKEPVDGSDGTNALVLALGSDAVEKKVVLFGKKRKIGEPTSFTFDGLDYRFTYGSKVHKLPFRLKLHDFIAEKYPGTTNSYAAFESKVEVLDGQNTLNADIYMNHVLDYRGYRFFQSSFHPDERGTILSVNHDFWGTWVTYAGYFLLYLGLLAILFAKKSRFGLVVRKLKRINGGTKWAGVVALLLITGQGYGQNGVDPMDPMVQKGLDSILSHFKIPEAHAAKFGHLIVQDANGRMKPMDTYTSEVLRKLSKNDSYGEFNANQAMLSMVQFPELWFNIPIIYLKRGNDSLRDILDVPSEAKLVPLAIFFDEKGEYKLEDQMAVAYKSILPNQFEKDFIETDRRVNLMYNTLRGGDLRLFPIPNARNDRWTSHVNLTGLELQKSDSLFMANFFPLYFSTVAKEIASGDFRESFLLLGQIEKFQFKYGSHVMPEASQVRLEVLYNKYDIFKNLFSWYLALGSILMVLAMIVLFWGRRVSHYLLWMARIGIYICFGLHTLGLVARWYISGHAPWSDAYESIIYISWATMLFGIYISKKFDLALAATAFVNAMILMVAHWNWLDPAIANLQPVLNSYWLMIHVAIIVASYGPFTLGMVLSILTLISMALMNQGNQKKLVKTVKKLTLLTEMTLTIGLVMLTIGNFLGGQWANESWGRYWAWDPKETWALISILIYAFIIHMRLVPRLNNKWLFSVMGALAFYSILMTYFGVNFYLSGLHSYAQGENIVTPSFIYYSLGVMGILAMIAYYKQRRYSV